jgi:hypothetical protein
MRMFAGRYLQGGKNLCMKRITHQVGIGKWRKIIMKERGISVNIVDVD